MSSAFRKIGWTVPDSDVLRKELAHVQTAVIPNHPGDPLADQIRLGTVPFTGLLLQSAGKFYGKFDRFGDSGHTGEIIRRGITGVKGKEGGVWLVSLVRRRTGGR